MLTMSTAPPRLGGLQMFARVAPHCEQRVLFEDLAPEAQVALLKYVFVDEASVEWTADTIVQLHFLLLDDCAKLADPETPLEEKFEILRWIYTDPEMDALPFSFASCLKLYAQAINPSQGTLDPREVRAFFRPYFVNWLDQSLDLYPPWVRTAFRDNPEWCNARLEKNPQWLNEGVRKHDTQGNLFD